MKSFNKVIKIIFHINKRTKYVKTYLNLLSKFYSKDICFDLLVINEKGNKIIKGNFKKLNIINVYSNNKIRGMNDIFKEIYKSNKILKEYKYCCFVEDDNFIFPNSLLSSKKFLDNNKDFIACSGEKFIYSKISNKKYQYLNYYLGPNTNSSKLFKDRVRNYNGSLCYYSLFRNSIFIKILKYITKIKDDNASEILFNFMTIKFGKINKLNCIYLAREYPRPKIYNIPNKTAWILNKNLFQDIHFVMKSVDNKYSDDLLNGTVYKYLSNRFKISKKININIKIISLIKKYKFYLLNFTIIKNFIRNINEIEI